MASIDPPASKEREKYLEKARAILEARKSELPFHRLLIYAQCQLSNYDGHPEAALAACDQALKVSPWSARANKEIGTAYLQIGQPERALASFTQAERLDRRHSVRSTWEIKAGITCLLLDRPKEALDWLSRAAEVNPSEPWILGLSAVGFNRIGDASSAQREISRLKVLPKREDATKEAVRNVLDFYRFADASLNAKLDSIVREFESLFDSQS
jgi:tetratricopeptide (TPR) repeat protein